MKRTTVGLFVLLLSFLMFSLLFAVFPAAAEYIIVQPKKSRRKIVL